MTKRETEESVMNIEAELNALHQRVLELERRRPRAVRWWAWLIPLVVAIGSLWVAKISLDRGQPISILVSFACFVHYALQGVGTMQDWHEEKRNAQNRSSEGRSPERRKGVPRSDGRRRVGSN